MTWFLPHPSSPARRGSTSPPKSFPSSGGKGLKAWPAGPVQKKIKKLKIKKLKIIRLGQGTGMKIKD